MIRQLLHEYCSIEKLERATSSVWRVIVEPLLLWNGPTRPTGSMCMQDLDRALSTKQRLVMAWQMHSILLLSEDSLADDAADINPMRHMDAGYMG